MKACAILTGLLLVCACSETKLNDSATLHNQITRKTFVLKTSTNLTWRQDIPFLNNKKYSGYLYQLFPDSKDTLSVEAYVEGQLNGIAKKWYPNNVLMEQREYENGKKNGSQIAYWQNRNKKFEFTAKEDAYEGELKEWTFEGTLTHLAHYVNGQEEGTQKLWYDNGKIRANYFIKNGKRFGLLGTKNCKNVSDSIFRVQ